MKELTPAVLHTPDGKLYDAGDTSDILPFRKRWEVAAALLTVAIVVAVPAGAFLLKDALLPGARDIEKRVLIIGNAEGGWSPGEVRIETGQRVELDVLADDVAHGFAIPELGLDTGLIKPGSMVRMAFVAGKEGIFHFVCSVFCGKGWHGKMAGKIVVGNPPPPVPMVNDTRLIELNMTVNGLVPANITVPQGESLQLRVRAVDATHELQIDGYHFRSGPIEKGVVKDYDFTASLWGNFTMDCPHHDMPHGKGMLSVTRTTNLTVSLAAKNEEDCGFSQKTIVLMRNDTVRLVVTSVDETHGLSIDGTDIDTGPVAPGTSKVIEFEAKKAGTYRFRCSWDCSAQHERMTGRIVVVE